MTTTTDREPGAAATASTTPGEPPRRGARFLRGRPNDPRWVRPTLLGLLAVTAVTYLWNLGASGYANSFYAAAVQAGTQSWKAWLFGALDAPGLITVDKPPAAMWVMVASGRIFGFSSWSMLVPQALMGVASVALVHATVRRWSGPRTALAAAAVLAFTPAAALMFRFNNPDALLVLFMVLAAYATTRAADAAGRRSGTWWLVAAGVAVGFGFLTKQLQVMLVVPALGLVYLLVAPTRLRRRIADLGAGAVAIVLSAGWYLLLVELWPASSRPYIGGSTDNSLLQLTLGYNGLSRILGGEGAGPGGDGRGDAAPAGIPPGMGGVAAGAGGGAGPGGPGSGGFGGRAGLGRLFTTEFSGNASWLLPAAVVLLAGGLWWTRRDPRTDRSRALLLLGGLWTLAHAVVFSYMSGIIHPYYTVAIVPGIAITAAAGASILWRRRAELAPRVVLAVVVVGTGVWSAVVLTQQQWMPELGWLLAGVAALGAVALLAAPTWRRVRGFGVVAVAVVLLGALGASTAFAAVTAVTSHQGPIVSAGANSVGFPGGLGLGGPASSADAGGAASASSVTASRMSGFLTGENTPPELTALLQQGGTRWSAATIGATSAAPLALASTTPVMAIGGFMGSDPAPTLAEFQQYVATGQVRYFIESGPGARNPGGGQGDASAGLGAQPQPGQPGMSMRGGLMDRGSSGEITTWVTTHFAATDVAGTTVYDLSRPTS